MSVNYCVQAHVVDIRRDQPKPTDIFLVDSNVWYWLTYSRASHSSHPYQLKHYPNYVVNAISLKAKLYQCSLILAELAHIIENTERDIFQLVAGDIGLKEFRHNHVPERNDVVEEIEAAWSQVRRMSQPLDFMLNDSVSDAVLARCRSQPLDGYDLLILEVIAKAAIIQVLTDDGDFATVPGITVFTANSNVIDIARVNRKLLKRS